MIKMQQGFWDITEDIDLHEFTSTCIVITSNVQKIENYIFVFAYKWPTWLFSSLGIVDEPHDSEVVGCKWCW